DRMSMQGNYVVIDHKNGEYSMLVHLRKGSVLVKVGETVKRGQPLGKIGMSGDSFMPHLHYELLTAALFDGEGLPSYFHDCKRLLGSRAVSLEKGQVDSGDFLECR